MDAVADIKARLSIEDLVGQYVQLSKKGRNFVSLCPFHKDTHPSFLVSPDKGIAYCFACQTGGDIFSFYQAIEGVNFPQALKDLAERTGVTLPDKPTGETMKKDEKDRVRDVLNAAKSYYKEQLAKSAMATEYLKNRKILPAHIDLFELGFAPDSFDATYGYLLKKGFSRSDLVAAGLGVQKELSEERIYDRFRNRLMIPIFDLHGHIIGFGGRTLGNDDAKYVNSPESPLYHKSSVLFGLHLAKESMRDTKRAVIVEGYFDLIACHKVGVTNVVATSGTALTPEHAKLLKRYVESVTLCMDQDIAGQDAAERAFHLLAAEGLHVQLAKLPAKDPDEVAQSEPETLVKQLSGDALPYIESVLERVKSSDLSSPVLKRESLRRVLGLIQSLPLAVEQNDYLSKAAAAFGTTETALMEDLRQIKTQPSHSVTKKNVQTATKNESPFTALEMALGMFLFYPKQRTMMDRLIEPEEGMAKSLFDALKKLPDTNVIELDELKLDDEYRERVSILYLMGEHFGFAEWSESLAIREIAKSCVSANKETLRRKQQDITQKLLDARSKGLKDEEAVLTAEYMQVLKLSKQAR